MGLLATPSRFFKPSRVRLVFLMLAGAAFVLTEFGRKVYRPYIRRNGIDDLGLADSIGNLGGILVQIFFTIAAVNATRRQCYALALFLSAGYIVYEVLQPFLPRGTFDWKDVGGTLLGMVVAMGVVAVVWRVNADEEREP